VIGKLFRITLWILFIAVAGLTCVSYLHAIRTGIELSDKRLLAVSIAHGNLEFGYYTAESQTSRCLLRIAEFIYNGKAEFRLAGFPWYRSARLNWETTAGVKYIGAGGSLLLPLVTFPAVMWAIKRRRRLAVAMREIVRPSGPHPNMPFGRAIRRSVIGMVGMASLLGVGIWVASYKYDAKEHCWHVDQDSLLLTDLERGYVKVVYVSCNTNGSNVPIVDQHLGGFGFKQTSVPSVLPAGQRPKAPNAPGPALDVTRVLWIPCWAPVVLFSAWPVFAFFRGPYRRAKQGATGFCSRCGYNLTGLVEPRCPECGTAFDRRLWRDAGSAC